MNRCLEGVTARVAAIRRTLEQIGLTGERLVLINQSVEDFKLPAGLESPAVAGVS